MAAGDPYDWKSDPVEVARHQAWEDAAGDGLLYRKLLDQRGIQPIMTAHIPDDPNDLSASSRPMPPEKQFAIKPL